MKTRYACIATGLSFLLMAGCDNRWEEVQPATPSETTREIRLTASLDDSSTRLGLTDEGGLLKSTWEENDSFQVFRADGSSTTFTLESGAGTSSATFVGTLEGATEGETLSAVFGDPSAYSMDNDKNLTLNISDQTGRLDSRYQLLYGECELRAEGTAFQFKHVVSLLKIVIPTTETLSQVTLSNSELFTQATLIINGTPSDAPDLSVYRGDIVYSMEKEQNGTYPNSVREGIRVSGTYVPQNEEVTVYLYILPAHFYYQGNGWLSISTINPEITALTEGGVKMYCASTFKGRELNESGKMYRLNAILYAPKDFPNEETADGQSVPYELWTEDDLYSLMMRMRCGIENKNGVGYQHCHYKLMGDITLTGKMPWTPETFYGELDGNGKVIGGNITSTKNCSLLFENIYDATIKNLTLAFGSVSFANTNMVESFGVLCECSINTHFEHVINLTNAYPYAYQIGGLAGKLDGNTTMIACGNEGNFTSMGEVRKMGGLVSVINGSNTIETCYNTGNLTASYADAGGIYMGGLVGRDESGFIALNACWSASERLNYNSYSMNGDVPGTIAVYDIIGEGNCSTCCYTSDEFPNEYQIAEMNSAMQNGVWIFTRNGRPGKDSSSSVPNIPAEDW